MSMGRSLFGKLIADRHIAASPTILRDDDYDVKEDGSRIEDQKMKRH